MIKVLLLRGVNVAGANRLPMPEFRALLEELGLTRVETHLQSGNAVFDDPGVADLPKKTATERVLAAKGVRSLAELGQPRA